MVKTVDAIIIEDDSSSVALLKEYLKDFTYIKLLGEATNIKDAEFLIKNNPQVDLVFMDIDLSDTNALDLMKLIHHKTKIIFITAYPDFAVKAFEYNTIDYIVKPISRDRFKKAITRLGKFENVDKIDNKDKPVKHTSKFGYDNMVLMNIDDEVLPPKDDLNQD
jgi:two-component system LytT family response regulator